MSSKHPIHGSKFSHSHVRGHNPSNVYQPTGGRNKNRQKSTVFVQPRNDGHEQFNNPSTKKNEPFFQNSSSKTECQKGARKKEPIYVSSSRNQETYSVSVPDYSTSKIQGGEPRGPGTSPFFNSNKGDNMEKESKAMSASAEASSWPAEASSRPAEASSWPAEASSRPAEASSWPVGGNPKFRPKGGHNKKKKKNIHNNEFYTGAKFCDSPDAKDLPMPPKHWLPRAACSNQDTEQNETSIGKKGTA